MKLAEIIIEIIEGIFKLLFEIIGHLFKGDTWKLEEGYNAELTEPSDILSKKGDGLSVGGKYFIDGKANFQHFLCVAQSGAGKSQTVATPSLWNLAGKGSVICLDVAKELRNATSSHYRNHGYKEIVINFSEWTKSYGWNPFPKEPDRLPQFIKALTDLELGTNTKDPYWVNAGQSLLITFAKTLYELPSQYQNPSSLLDLLTLFSAKPELVDKYMSVFADEKTWNEYLAFNNASDNLKASIISTAKTALNIFADENIRHITSSRLDLSSIRKEKTILYLQTSALQLNRYKTLISLFWDDLFAEVLKELPEKDEANIYAILDEAGIYKIDSLALAITQGRKFRLSISLLCQTEFQMYSLYGKEEGRTIIENCYSRLYLTNQPIQTARELEEISGKREYEDKDGKKKIRSLLLSDEIRSLPPDKALFLFGHHRPAILPLVFFHEKHKTIEPPLPIPQILSSTIPPIIPIEQLINDHEKRANPETL